MDSICAICKYRRIIKETMDSPREEWCDFEHEEYGEDIDCPYFCYKTKGERE